MRATYVIGRLTNRRDLLYVVEYWAHEPSMHWMERRKKRRQDGWFILFARSRKVLRIGPDHGRFDTADEALATLVNCYPHYTMEAWRE